MLLLFCLILFYFMVWLNVLWNVIMLCDFDKIQFSLYKEVKDARSVSLYPYKQSHFLLFVKYKKVALQKKLQNFVTNNVVLYKK